MKSKKEDNNSGVYIENIIGKLKIDQKYLIEKEIYEYDSLGRVIKIHFETAPIFITKSYDKSGVTVIINGGNGGIYKTKYDNDGNVTYRIETYNDKVLYRSNRRKANDKVYYKNTRYKEDGSICRVEKKVFLDTKTKEGYVLINTFAEDDYSIKNEDVIYNAKWQKICHKTRIKIFYPDNRKEYTATNIETLYYYDDKGRLISYSSNDNWNHVIKYYDKYSEEVVYIGDELIKKIYSLNANKSKDTTRNYRTLYRNETGNVFKDYWIFINYGKIRNASFAARNKVYKYYEYENMNQETVRELEVTIHDPRTKLAMVKYRINCNDEVGDAIYNEVAKICNKIIDKEFSILNEETGKCI